MLVSRRLRSSAAIAAALVLSLAACGASQNEDPAGGGTDTAETTESAPASQPESESEPDDAGSEGSGAEEPDTGESPSAADESAPADGDDDAATPETGTLLITLNGEETTFTPEIVRCNGEPGTIRNAVITMKDDELPLVKVTPGEFAMVKMQQQGEPEKSSSTQGVTAEDGTIVFDNASIGDAVVGGTVDCLQGNQG